MEISIDNNNEACIDNASYDDGQSFHVSDENVQVFENMSEVNLLNKIIPM